MNESTSLLCLFRHQDHASAAVRDLQHAGIAPSVITSIAGPGAPAQLSAFDMPDRDRTPLEKSLREGAILLAVSAAPHQVEVVERVFAAHSAKFVDEFERETAAETASSSVSASEAGRPIPMIEEELIVGKRTVDQGGVRVFRRIVEIPTSAAVNLHEERVIVERQAVDRLATESDLAAGNQSVVLTETAEEVVLSKTARVVEEVLVTRHSTDRVVHVQDTVRRTEVDVEELAPETPNQPPSAR